MSAPPSPTTRPTSDADLRASLRSELEQTRELFLELAAEANQAKWSNHSGNPAWTVGQVLGHMVLIFSAIPMKMNRLRKGKGIPKPPDFLFDPLNSLSTRLGTRKYRPDNIVAAYEEAHAAALETLDSIKDDEWSLSATFFGEHQDTAELFRYHARHVREHASDVRAGTAGG